MEFIYNYRFLRGLTEMLLPCPYSLLNKRSTRDIHVALCGRYYQTCCG